MPARREEIRQLHPRQQQASEKATRERSICRDWLLEMMAHSPVKPFSKDVLRSMAMAKFGVSKNSFDVGWGLAIIESGNFHWYQPGKKKLPRA